MAESIPSWLNIDPIASTSRMLQGYATGAQIGESLRQGEAQAAARANQAAQFSAELAQRQAQAEREYQRHQEIEQEKAKMAARNMVGMQEYQALVASGLPKDKALMQAAPNLFYGQASKLPGALHQLGMEQQASENALRMEDAQRSTQALQEAQIKHYDVLNKPKAEPSKMFHVGNSLIRVNPDGGQEILFQSNDPDKIDQWQHSELMAQLNASKQLGIDSPEYKQAKQDLDNFSKGFRKPKSEAAAEQQPLPLPRTEAELKIGFPYITLRGVAKWNGTHFVK